ncbi:DUF5689 domain-containing protein [Tenacibaculum sp. C7A-26P2]|uniref:DUF5689 domain-containing protein n=1 Tax=Tenacibaculum sp. C7A-26P2 TaxID=3447504 RepID=UPI003F847586
MKTSTILNMIILAVFFEVTVSCVDNNDYNLPQINIDEPNIIANTSISGIIRIFNEQANGVLDFSTIQKDEMVLEGYVVSSDEAGNMYKILSIQDKPKDPTAAIQLTVDDTDMYTFFNVGRKVFVPLNGLGMHNNNGVLEIGKLNGGAVDRISLIKDPEAINMKDKYSIMRSSEVAQIEPREIVSITDLNSSHISMLISIDNMQIEAKDQTFANLNNTFSVNRVFKSCADEETIIMRNSGFADFRAQLIPNMQGKITGIVGNYRGAFQLLIRDTNDLDLIQSRCEPVYAEDFQSVVGNADFDIDGWINYTEKGSKVWTEKVFQSNGYVEFNPYGSDDSENVSWLITPRIDLENQDNEVLTFQTQHAYPDSGHDPLEILISTDFDGTEEGIEYATWNSLDSKISYIEDFSSWFTFVDSGEVDISLYEGIAYIAFKYTGSDRENKNMTIHVDNVKVSVK